MINSFHCTDYFLYALKTDNLKHQTTKGFLMFTGDIEKAQWHEMS